MFADDSVLCCRPRRIVVKASVGRPHGLLPEFSVSPESGGARLTGFVVSVYTLRTLCVCLQQESDSHSPSNRQRNDRKADFRCGANPQRGESSWAFRQKICNPSPAFWPPANGSVLANTEHLRWLRARLDAARNRMAKCGYTFADVASKWDDTIGWTLSERLQRGRQMRLT